ncbi:Tubulin alpha-8 chain-like, partial [Homarus americanus]
MYPEPCLSTFLEPTVIAGGPFGTAWLPALSSSSSILLSGRGSSSSTPSAAAQGSGFTSHDGETFPETTAEQAGFIIYPAPQLPVSSSSCRWRRPVVEPYNSIDDPHHPRTLLDCVHSWSTTGPSTTSAAGTWTPERPTYTNLNRLIGQIVSSITASLRLVGSTTRRRPYCLGETWPRCRGRMYVVQYYGHREAWARLDHKFDLMCTPRAFVHWWVLVVLCVGGH